MTATPMHPDVVREIQDIASGILARRKAEAEQRSRAWMDWLDSVSNGLPQRTVAAVQVELSEARHGFDPLYQFADDYTYWARMSRRADRIAGLERELAQLTAAAEKATSK